MTHATPTGRFGGDAPQPAPVLCCPARMGNAIVKPYMTFADYLEAEGSSDVKHEWFNGSVYAMSRGTPEHARLTLRIGWLLRSALPAVRRRFPLPLLFGDSVDGR